MYRQAHNAATSRGRSPLLPLFFILCSGPIATSAFATSATVTVERASNLTTMSSSIEEIDVILAESDIVEMQEVTRDLPDWPNEPYQGPNVSVDRASLPSRYDQGTPDSPQSGFQVATPHQHSVGLVLFVSTYSSSRLPGQIRGRAPPLP
jgi:hypothetical protein